MASRDRLRSLRHDRRQRHPLDGVQLRKIRNAAKALETAQSRDGVSSGLCMDLGCRSVIVSRLPYSSLLESSPCPLRS